MDIKIMPMGITENQAFGVDALPDPHRSIEKLWLEIPINKSLNLYNFSSYSNNKVFDGTGKPVFEAGKITKNGLKAIFQAQVALSNGEVGLTVDFESRDNWVVVDEEDAVEIEETEDAYILRYKLITQNPKIWTEDSSYYSPQICFRCYSFQFYWS